MRSSIRAAVTVAASAALVPLLAAPALACPDPHKIAAKGPTKVYDDKYEKTETKVAVAREKDKTVVKLRVSGFPKEAAGKTFGTHVHAKKCGPKPEDAGPHYENPDAKPGTPLREKEIWLDVKIGEDGKGRSRAVVPWKVAKGSAGSVIVHAEPTDPKTGDAGARLTCTDVPF
ncbi:superoxide dismutase family protein [Actinomadura sp. 7K507]|uniref:superoxide dismutase family protein n=1 Tax=Actinomadura sp. 7K507 TaxID=2530365 RepID=UPI001047C1C7|nr:superoxide dismutase family protein [Actinomadura sp. 7K507]TDC78185.1 superoxide dismutase family protein [Actinomadura sp. 7K507]